MDRQPTVYWMVWVLLGNPAFAGLPLTTGRRFRPRNVSTAMLAFYRWQNWQEGDYVIGIEQATCHAGSRDPGNQRGEMISSSVAMHVTTGSRSQPW